MQPGHCVLGRGDNQPAAGDDGTVDHRRGLGDDVGPVLGLRAVEVGGHHPTPRCVQVGDRVEPTAGDLAPRGGLLPLDDHRAQVGLPVEQDHVGAGRHVADVEDQPAPVVGDRCRREGRLLQVAQEQHVGVGLLAQHVPPDRFPVALLAGGDCGRVGQAAVGEGRAVGQPGERRVADVGDLVAQVVAAVDVDDAQGAVLAPAFGHAVGHQPPVGRGAEPVDGGGVVGRHAVRVDDRARLRSGVDRRAHDQRGLVLVALALEREDPISDDVRRADHADLEELVEAGVQRRPGRYGVEHRPGALVLGRAPARDLLRVSVLEPPVGVVHLGAVQHLDHVSRRRGRRRGNANGRRSASCRGWPSCAGP